MADTKKVTPQMSASALKKLAKKWVLSLVKFKKLLIKYNLKSQEA